MRSKQALSLIAIAGALIFIPTAAATAAPAASATLGMERTVGADGGIVEKVHRRYRYVARRHYRPYYYPYYAYYGPRYYTPYYSYGHRRRSGFALYLSF